MNESKQMKTKFFALGYRLPTCANDGCDKPVIVRDWKNWSFKNYCSDCNRRMRKGLPARSGVRFHKKDYCENRDGRLGFTCPVTNGFQLPHYTLHSDHIDGNRENNHPNNIQTLCAVCHAIKGMQQKDFHSSIKGRKMGQLGFQNPDNANDGENPQQ